MAIQKMDLTKNGIGINGIFLLCRNGTKLGKGFDTCYVNMWKKILDEIKKSHLSKSATLELMGSEFHLVEMHKQNLTESYFVF